MKNLLKTTFAILFLILATSCSKDNPQPQPVDTKLQLPAILTNNTAVTIPDAITFFDITTGTTITSNGVAESSIVIDKDGIVKQSSGIIIQIDLAHENASDISVALIAPDGTSCGLIKRIGLVNTAYITGNKLNFNSQFATFMPLDQLIIPTGDYSQTITFNPIPTEIQMLPNLNDFFLNKNIKGTWKLKVYDSAKLKTGTLNSWSLKFLERTFTEI